VFQQFVPRSFSVLAEEHDNVLAFVKIETQALFVIAFRGTISRTGDVIDVSQHSTALGMGEFYKFHNK
jgi:hypothetical protein